MGVLWNKSFVNALQKALLTEMTKPSFGDTLFKELKNNQQKKGALIGKKKTARHGSDGHGRKYRDYHSDEEDGTAQETGPKDMEAVSFARKRSSDGREQVGTGEEVRSTGGSGTNRDQNRKAGTGSGCAVPNIRSAIRKGSASAGQLQEAVIWAEILGDPVSRKRRKKRENYQYGSQGYAGGGRGRNAASFKEDH